MPDGSKYVGEWQRGEEHGQGTYTLPNGDKYVGEYKDGERHGQGTSTALDGSKYVGEWEGGRPWKGAQYDKDGDVTVTWSESVKKSLN